MLTEHVDTRALARLEAEAGADLVALSRALEILRETHLCGRVLVELSRMPNSQWLDVSDASTDQTIGVRDANQTGCWLGEPIRVSPDTLAWPLPASMPRTVFWLEVANGARTARVAMADPEWAILSAHGWRWDVVDTTAEASLWVADFIEVIARALTGVAPQPQEPPRSPIDRRVQARRALVATQMSHASGT